MSVRSRLEDAKHLYEVGRFDGALLSVLVAVAATSRKRRPMPEQDRVAFESFLREEMLVVTGGAVESYHVRFRGKMVRMEELLYRFVRNQLAHEGKLPTDVRFERSKDVGSLLTNVTEDSITLSESWMDGLSKCVQFAPENHNEFPGIADTPVDVLKWLMFGKRREGANVEQYWERRVEFATTQIGRPSEPRDQGASIPAGRPRTLEEIRRDYPSAYDKWSKKDDELLAQGFRRGNNPADIAALLGRQPGAIRSRLSKLGLV